jgi:hypothetical protein
MIVKHAGDRLIGGWLNTALSNIENRTSNNVWRVTGPGVLTAMWENTDDTSLFDGFAFLSPVKLAQYISQHSLPYVEQGMHWSEVQKRMSIFVDRNE